jgi:hypothetical protein
VCSVGAEVAGRRGDGHGGARPSVGKTSSSPLILTASARFPAPDDGVEYGGDDSTHGVAWGCPYRRRCATSVRARVSEFGGKRRTGARRASAEYLYGSRARRRSPRSSTAAGTCPSPSSWRPPVRATMEKTKTMTLVFDLIPIESVGGLGWATAW